jgi:septum formation protein
MMEMTRVFLASQSPRRREILSNNYKNIHVVSASTANEPRWEKGLSPDLYLKQCVDFKVNLAKRVFLSEVPTVQLMDRNVLVVADTIVEKDEIVFGKPENKKDAFRILKALSGNTHLVKTQVAIEIFDHSKNSVSASVFTAISRIEFHKLTHTQIGQYIESGEPFDKAGAYGFQDLALKFVKSIEGSYLNVVGFPLLEFDQKLKQIL